MTRTFLYFAYGSNLLTKRIHINNPTAVRKCAAKLKNFRLDFDYWSNRWSGYAATIVPHQGEHVWGAVWEIDSSNMEDLDRQEGVHENVYRVINVQVETENGEELLCRSYQLCSLPDSSSPSEKRLPSKVYLDTIIRGAKESNLPEGYLKQLSFIKHNNFEGTVKYDIN